MPGTNVKMKTMKKTVKIILENLVLHREQNQSVKISFNI